MTPARQLAQTDPTENLAHQIGQEVTRATTLIADLERSLRRLDEKRELLRARGLIVDVDLGDIGNAAQAVRRTCAERDQSTKFRLPGAAA